MKEAEWLACEDPSEVFRQAPHLVPSHRWVLWWVASCRHAWGKLSAREKAAVEAFEVALRTPPARTNNKFLQAVRTAHAGRPPQTARFARMFRDVVGNPFRSVAFSPSWRTDTAVGLARQVYEGRDFSAMPILADTLQDAGCDNTDVLDHCRDPSPHVRGCWVVDLLLDKE